MGAQAQQIAQGQTGALAEVPEQVLVTGSLIHGTVAVGVPITTLGDADFKETGALTTADLLKNLPSVTVIGSLTVTNTGGNLVGAQQTEIHGIGGDQSAPKTLLMIDGKRTPNQGPGLCIIDPSIIPSLAIDRIDVLADGASATYGSDAIAGVINVILKRGFEGAVTQFRIADSTGLGGLSVAGSQLYGKKWDSGDVTVTYEFYHVNAVQGPGRDYFTYDFSPWGLDNRTPLVAASPGIVSTGAPVAPSGTPGGFSASSGTTCNNCFSVPKGQNGVGLTWATLLANKNVGNEYNPYSDASVLPETMRNAVVATFDQDVWKGDGLVRSVQFYAEGFYNNRRNVFHSAGTTGATKTNALTQAIPTINPYYPIGAPAGLRVSYDFAKGEVTGRTSAGVQQGRWEGGFNLELPADWIGKISYARTEDHEFDIDYNKVNPNLVNAAVGNVVASDGVSASFTKPSNIPYLNLFCDPTAFTCNDPATIAYITTHRSRNERSVFNEASATADGSLFQLPGGAVRAAIGGDYFTYHYAFTDIDGSNSLRGDAAPNIAPDSGAYNVWAAFAQLNIPIVGAANAIPFVQALEFELSGRIDHYSNVGTTKNPKFAITWNVGSGFTLRGSTGTSFRAPSFADLTAASGATIDPLNVLGGANANSEPTCSSVGATPTPGSAAAILNPTCSAALLNPGGIRIGGGAGAAAAVRGPGFHLSPESARTWNLGFDFAPTDFLRGLDLNATVYNIKINGVIQGASRGNGLNDPTAVADGFFVLPTDPNFASYVAAIVKMPTASPSIIPANILFIEDGAQRNVGWIKYQGIDFSGSYDVDLGDFGAWNTGITGNYVLSRQTLSGPGTPVFDAYKDTDSGGRLNYRARLGWAGGPESAWSITGFMNYHAHIGNQQAGDNVRIQALPPGCFMVGNTACNASGLPQFAQYTQQYPLLTNFEPAWISFDLSIGYKTGDMPVNDYLKNIGFQFTVNNILDKRPNFAYITSTSGGTPDAFDRRLDPMQRVVSFVVTKAW